MINALVILYDRRLRQLLYYDNEEFTRKLMEHMFHCFDEITERGQRMYASNINRYISSILEHSEVRSKQVESALALHEIRTYLEFFIKYIIIEFWPEEKEKIDALNPKKQSPQDGSKPKSPLDYRALIGQKMKECQQQHPELFPKELGANLRQLIRELRHSADVRNSKIHMNKIGVTTKFKRYAFLGAYSTLLGFIIYAYYHQKFQESRQIELTDLNY